MEQENRQISYDEALQQINDIIESLQNGQADIDTLAEQVSKATALIELCRAKLTKTEQEVAKIYKE